MTTSTKGFKIGFRYLSFFALNPVTLLQLLVTDIVYTATDVTLTVLEHGLFEGDTIVVVGLDSDAGTTGIDGTWVVKTVAGDDFTFDIDPTNPPAGTSSPINGVAYLDVTKALALQLPAALSDVNVYEGLHYESARAMTINYPQPRKIEHQGDDRVEALDFLPPSTAMDAEIHVGMSNLDIISLLSGIKVASLATSEIISLATDKQGLEPFVGILAYSQSLDWPVGDRTWQWYFFPYARAIYAPSSLAETPQDLIFRVAPQFTSTLPWGLGLVSTVNGNITHQGIQGISMGRPHLACWKAGASTPDYVFDVAHPAYDASSIEVFVNGVPKTPSATSVLGFSIAPPNPDDIVIAWYEE